MSPWLCGQVWCCLYSLSLSLDFCWDLHQFMKQTKGRRRERVPLYGKTQVATQRRWVRPLILILIRKAGSKERGSKPCVSYFLSLFAKSSGTSAGRFATGTFAFA